MTCIVATEYVGGAVLACDSYIGYGDFRERLDSPKWVQTEHVTMAYAGELWACQEAVEAIGTPPKPGKLTDIEYLRKHLVMPLREAMEDHGGDIDFSAIAIIRGRVYKIDGGFCVFRCLDGYCAIGIGTDIAMGVLYDTRKAALKPVDRCVRALEAAAYHSSFVVRPFRWLDIPYQPQVQGKRVAR